MKSHVWDLPTGPRRPDAFQLAKIKVSSLEVYRKALQPFISYLIEKRFSPRRASQWDDLLVEWRNECSASKSNFEQCVAAVEFVLPSFRGHLSWSHSVISGWAVVHIPRHTVPIGLGACCLVAAHLASDHPRLALGIIIQRLLGLRPSELLAVQCRDVQLPSAGAGEPVAIVGLGIRGGTKAKRSQAVVMRDLLGIGLLRYMCAEAESEQAIVGYTYEQYRRLLAKVERSLGLELGWTPHSPRSGFASELWSSGVPFSDIRERGRWVADSSLRTYIDVVASAQIAVSLRLSGHSAAIAFSLSRLLYFFPGARLYCHEALSNAAEGFTSISGTGEGTERNVVPTLAGPVGAAACGIPFEIQGETGGHASTSSTVQCKAAGSQPQPAGADFRNGAPSSSPRVVDSFVPPRRLASRPGRGRGRGTAR